MCHSIEAIADEITTLCEHLDAGFRLERSDGSIGTWGLGK
jgi:hypothetical protein